MQATQQSSDAMLAHWYQSELDAARKAKQLMLACQTDFEVVRDQVESYKNTMPEWQRASFEVHAFAGRYGWSLSVDLAVDTFKDPIAVNIIDFLLHTFPDNGKTETNDYAQIGHRDVSFEQPGFAVTVSMRLRGEGTEGCRRVLTGVKTVEQREYEFRCD